MHTTKPLSQQSLQKKLQQKEQELSILFDISQKIARLDLDEVLAALVTSASTVTNADSCLVYLLALKKSELILRASKNPHGNVLGRIKMKMGEGITGWVAQNKQPIVLNEKAGADKRFKFFHKLPEDRFEAFLSVPILNKHGVVGVINVQHKKKHVYSKSEVDLLTAIGRLAGASVENAQLIAETVTLKSIVKTRKLLEKAKGILMKRFGIDEETAYHKIRKQSMDMRKSIADIADAIILSDQFNS